MSGASPPGPLLAARLVGREGPLGLIRALLQGERGTTVRIAGEAGVGKTRLARAEGA
jgi:MoxR-like ATPase